MEKIPFYRRRLVVNWSLQVRYAVLLAIFSALFAFVMGFFALRAYAELIDSRSELNLRTVMVVGWGLGLTAAAAAFGLVVSNRWAGPLYRMERYLKQMANGELPVINPPRKGDELHGLFATFRAASEQLRSRQERELETLEGTLRLLDKPDSGVSPEVVAELRRLAEQKRTSLTPAPAPSLPAAQA